MIQLDTHSLLWLESEYEKLSPSARAAIEASVLAGERIAISAITLWEITLLARRKRILANVSIQSFLMDLEENYRVVPVIGTIAFLAAELPASFPKDPMDRLIAATAIVENLTLITADRDILASQVCKVLW